MNSLFFSLSEEKKCFVIRVFEEATREHLSK